MKYNVFEMFFIANLDLDGTSQLSYSEILSYEDQPISTLSQSPCESRNTRHHGPCHQETGMVRSLSRPCVESILEAETVFTNRSFEDSYATHSSSVWSPEVSCWLSFLFWKVFSILCFSTMHSLSPPQSDISRQEVLPGLENLLFETNFRLGDQSLCEWQ